MESGWYEMNGRIEHDGVQSVTCVCSYDEMKGDVFEFIKMLLFFDVDSCTKATDDQYSNY